MWRTLLCTLLFSWGCQEEPAAPAASPAQDRAEIRAWLEAETPPADPREAADAAFNEAMMASETGQPGAPSLIAAALAAYDRAGELNADEDFHVAVLLLAAGRATDARAQADQILAQAPTHLLALGVGLRAARGLGDDPAARTYAQRLLDALATAHDPLPEYEDHSVLLPIYEAEARELLGG